MRSFRTNKMVQHTFVFALSLMSFFVTAADVPLPAVQIKNLRISDTTQTLYVQPTSAVDIKNETCAFTDLYAISADDLAFNQMHAMLLTAGAAGRNVKLWISDAADDCVKGRQRIRIVEIQF